MDEPRPGRGTPSWPLRLVRWPWKLLRTLFRVILPNLREAVLAACLLTFVIVLGEFTIASIALYQTFPVYITTIGSSEAFPAAALTVIAVGLTFLAAATFLVLGRLGSRRRSEPVLGAAMTGVAPAATPNTGAV